MKMKYKRFTANVWYVATMYVLLTGLWTIIPANDGQQYSILILVISGGMVIVMSYLHSKCKVIG